MMQILPASTEEHIQQIHSLFVEYTDSLGIDLGFQDLQHFRQDHTVVVHDGVGDQPGAFVL